MPRSAINLSEESRRTATIFVTVCLKIVNTVTSVCIAKTYVCQTEHQSKMN